MVCPRAFLRLCKRTQSQSRCSYWESSPSTAQCKGSSPDTHVLVSPSAIAGENSEEAGAILDITSKTPNIAPNRPTRTYARRTSDEPCAGRKRRLREGQPLRELWQGCQK